MAAGLGDLVLGAYCERGFDPSFWAEPMNAISNAAFVLAGVAAFARSRGDGPAMLLAVVIVVIGAGSFLFHTLATRGAMIADVAPIQAFIAIYVFLAMRRFVGLGAAAACAATLAFMATAGAVPRFVPAYEPWRGLGGYLGGLIGLIGLGAGLLVRRGPVRRIGLSLIAIAGLFAVSLAFRTVDGVACPSIATGTHFVWHALNAVVLYALALLMHRARPENDGIET